MAIKRRVVDHNQLASEIKDSFGVIQRNYSVSFVEGLYSENKIQT